MWQIYSDDPYVYGTAVSFGSPGPDVHRNDLLRAVIYPDSLDTYSGGTLNDGAAGYDRVEYKYNRQGEVIELMDQNGTVQQCQHARPKLATWWHAVSDC